MTTATNLGLVVSLRVHDASQTEVSAENILKIMNAAVDDLSAADIVLPIEEDESLTIASGTFTYTVPADFTYVKEIRLESAASSGKYPTVIDPSLYRIVYDGAATKIQFDENEFESAKWDGRKMKLVGQKRPPQLSGGDTVTPGLEQFIRERAVAYAAQYVGGGLSELAQQRQRIGELAWQQSEALLEKLAFTPAPSAVRVPTR